MRVDYIKILQDNYAWLIIDDQTQEAIVIDCGDYIPILNFLQKNNLTLKYILITHAHADHLLGIEELKKATNATIVGNQQYQHRLPPLDMLVEDGSQLSLLGCPVTVIETKGHCADHLIYHFSQHKWLFVGDFIFSLGCGKVFEGTNADMVHSIYKIKHLSDETLLFPSHEYTKSNLLFTQSLNYFNLPPKTIHNILTSDVTLPTSLGFERQYNPFLQINNTNFIQTIFAEDLDEVTFFTYLRERKNEYTKLKGG